MADKIFKESKSLSKNPLGIIALLISAIYGIASLVLSISFSELKTPYERLPLIWFVIIFPILILIGFIYLVIFHHEKLYSPGDFKEDKHFLEAMDKKSINTKYDKEAKTLDENTQITIEDDDDKPSEKINTDKPDSQIYHLKQKLLNAEKWVLNEIQIEWSRPFKSNMQATLLNGQTTEIDGISEDGKHTYIVETLFCPANTPKWRFILNLQKYLFNYPHIKNTFSRKNKFNAIIAIVYEPKNKNSEPEYMYELVDQIKKTDPNIIIKKYAYDDLEQKFL